MSCFANASALFMFVSATRRTLESFSSVNVQTTQTVERNVEKGTCDYSPKQVGEAKLARRGVTRQQSCGPPSLIDALNRLATRKVKSARN